jgi:hypothetical protein
MKNKILYLLVEGKYDTDFVETFVRDRKCLSHKYRTVVCQEYGEGADESKIQRYIKSYEEAGDDYLLLADADFNDELMSLKEKEEEVSNKYDIPTNKIWIVINEIESWLLSGFDENFCNQHNIKYYKQTDRVTKEDFLKIAKKKYKKREESSFRKFLGFTHKSKFLFKGVIDNNRNQSLKEFYMKNGLKCTE